MLLMELAEQVLKKSVILLRKILETNTVPIVFKPTSGRV